MCPDPYAVLSDSTRYLRRPQKWAGAWSGRRGLWLSVPQTPCNEMGYVWPKEGPRWPSNSQSQVRDFCYPGLSVNYQFLQKERQVFYFFYASQGPTTGWANKNY